MLIQSFFQLTPGIFILFQHYVSGKYSQNKATDLTLFFIFGVETLTTLVFLSIYFIVCALSITPINFTSDFFAWFLSGILAAISLTTFFCYYRKSSGTELFISRRLAHNLHLKASSIKNRSDAFILGFVSSTPELLFTVPLYLIATISIMYLGNSPITRSTLVLLYILFAVLPLLILRALHRTHHNLADFIRFRIGSKTFFRILISLSYLLLATLIIFTRISN